MAFYTGSRTGGLARIIERGTRSVAMTYRAVVFTFIPTAVELVLVCWLLSRALHPGASLIVLGTFALYSVYTVQVRSRHVLPVGWGRQLDCAYKPSVLPVR